MRGQVHWMQQAEAALHPGYLLSPRLGKCQKYSGQTPARGMDHSVKAGMAETGAANINTRSGPKHKSCRSPNHSHLEQRAAMPLLLLSATGREASLQHPWLQLHVVQVIVAHIVGSGGSMPGKAGAGAKLSNVLKSCATECDQPSQCQPKDVLARFESNCCTKCNSLIA